MTDNTKKVSELPPTTVISNSDVVLVVTSTDTTTPATKKAALSTVSSYINSMLPTANSLVGGIVQVGNNINNVNGIISMPLANYTNVGVVGVGNNLYVDTLGFMSAAVANTTAAGVVKVGNNLNINSSAYLNIPVSSNLIAGVVKVGNNLTINSTGFLSLANTFSALPNTGASVGYVLTARDSSGSNIGWQAFSGVNDVTSINTRFQTRYTITSNDSVILANPAVVGDNITITLPIATAIEGKEILVKLIDASAGGKVTITTDDVGNAYLENPITGAFVNSYDLVDSGQAETWIHDGTVYRHLNTARATPIFYTNSNTYSQVVIKNASSGNNASSDLVLYNNLGVESSGVGPYIDLGINSNTYSNSLYTINGPNDGYIFIDNNGYNGGNLTIGTSYDGSIVFHANGTTSDKKILSINSTSVTVNSNIFPSTNNTLSLGNSSMRWEALWVGSNSIIFADSNRAYPDQILTVSNGIFNILTANGTSQSNAGLRVGSFTFENQAMTLANTYANIDIGTVGAIAPINFNRPINVRDKTGTFNLLKIDTDGIVTITSNSSAAGNVGALQVTGSLSGDYQSTNNPGVMIHVTGLHDNASRIYNDSFGNTYPAYVGRAARGYANAPTQTKSGDTINRIGANPYGTTGYSPISTIRMDFVNQEDQTGTNKGNQIQFWTTANGSSSVTKRATINETGLTLTGNVVFSDGSVQNTAFNATNAVTKINVGIGLTQSGNVGVVGIDSTAVLSVAGTANQVSVSNVGGNYTLSLPQNLNTNATVQFGRLTVANLTVTGTLTSASNSSLTQKSFNLAYDSTSSSQLDGGGFTLGNTSSSYYVGVTYNLANNSWNTGNTNLITKNISGNTVNANTGIFQGALHVGSAYLGYDFPNADIQSDCNINSYNQIVQQNHNSGTQGSADYVAVNDIGDDSIHYIDFGINSSTYANNFYSMGGPNDGYLYVNGGNLDIATQSSGKDIQFFTGNTTSDSLRATINSTGLAVVGNVTATNILGNFIGSFSGSISGYQTTAGLASNVATLTANLATYIIANTGLVSNSSGVFVNTSYIDSIVTGDTSNFQTKAGLASNVATLTSNNTSYVGTITAANVVSNAQLTANLNNYALLNSLNNYQSINGLASNVAVLTSNNTFYVGTVAAANVVSNAQLIANLGNYVLSSALSSALAGYQTSADLSANVGTMTSNNTSYVGTVTAANVVSNAQLIANLANYQTSAGLVGNVATLTSNNTSYVGTVSSANVVSNAQLVANLANYQTAAGLSGNVAILTSNNTYYVGTVAAANVVSNTQLASNLANYQTLSGLNANVAALGFTNTSSSYTISGVRTHSANLVINTGVGISANGTYGTNGQVLTTNGTAVYWNTPFPNEQIFSLEADRTLLTANASQSMFGVGVTLATNTKYRYMIYATVYKANTSGASTGSLQFAITNTTATAVLGRSYFVTNPRAANTTQTSVQPAYQMSQNITTSFSTPVTITPANTGATWYDMVIDGTLDVTTGGTLNPQIAFTHTANLGSGTLLQAGATIEIWPIGNATSNSVIGTWA